MKKLENYRDFSFVGWALAHHKNVMMFAVG